MAGSPYIAGDSLVFPVFLKRRLFVFINSFMSSIFLFLLIISIHDISNRYPLITIQVWKGLGDHQGRLSLFRLYAPFFLFVTWFSGFQILTFKTILSENISASRHLAAVSLVGLLVFVLFGYSVTAPFRWMLLSASVFNILVIFQPRVLGYSIFHKMALYVINGALGLNCLYNGQLLLEKGIASIAVNWLFLLGVAIIVTQLYFIVRFCVVGFFILFFPRRKKSMTNHTLLVGSSSSICGVEHIVNEKIEHIVNEKNRTLHWKFSLQICFLDNSCCVKYLNETFSLWITLQWITRCQLSLVERLRSILLEHCRNQTPMLLFNPENDELWENLQDLDYHRRRTVLLYQRIKSRSVTSGLSKEQLADKIPSLILKTHKNYLHRHIPDIYYKLDSLPYPFAWLLFNIVRSSTVADKFYLLISLFESFIHTLGILCINCLDNSCASDSVVSKLSEKIRQYPAMGDWLQSIEIYCRNESESFFSSVLSQIRIDWRTSVAVDQCKEYFKANGPQRIQNPLHLMAFAINLRNVTIGHGAFVYRVPQEIDNSLEALGAYFGNLVREIGLCMQLEHASDVVSLTGFDPETPSIPGSQSKKIFLKLENIPPVQVSFLRYFPQEHDVYYFNGCFRNHIEWKSYITGDYKFLHIEKNSLI